jgi:hypothetical protein
MPPIGLATSLSLRFGRSASRRGCGSCVGLLSSVSDDQIGQLIPVGIPGSDTAAYSLDFGGTLTSSQVTAITTYLRSLEPTAPDVPEWRSP